MAYYSWANCPKEIHNQVRSLADGVKDILGEFIVGIYLHGSLATGCFNPSRSDIDALVVQEHKSAISKKRQLAKLLLCHSSSPAPIEISFLNLDDINPWQYPTPYDFHFGEDHRARVKGELDSGDWKRWNAQQKYDEDLAAHVTIIRERGVCINGSPISEVFPIVPHEDYLSSILSDFHWVRDHVVESPVYAVLNMCRVLAYTREAKIFSKREAGEWALDLFPIEYKNLIQSALDVYANDDPCVFEEDVLISFASYMDREVMTVQ